MQTSVAEASTLLQQKPAEEPGFFHALTRDWRRESWLAGTVSLVCLVAHVAVFFVPWIESNMAGRAMTLDREALINSGIAYERHLAQWTAIALPVAAFALAAGAWLAPPRDAWWRGQARASVWLVAAAASAVAAIIGARLAGFEIARILDPGPTTTHLRAGAYVVIGAGFLALAAAGTRVWFLVRPRIDPAVTICAATLFAAPLVPFGTVAGDYRFHFDELTLALVQEVSEGPMLAAVRDLALARTLLGVMAVLGVAMAVAALWLPQRLKAWMAWTPAVLLPLLAGAAFLAIRFHVRWADLDAIRPGWNYLMPLGALAALTLHTIPPIRRIRQRPWRHPE